MSKSINLVLPRRKPPKLVALEFILTASQLEFWVSHSVFTVQYGKPSASDEVYLFIPEQFVKVYVLFA
jgi:hypothetical protein